MSKVHLLAAAAVACAALTATAQAELVHNYTFNDGTGADSVGSADGTLVGTATISGGQLVGNANGSYLGLPTSSVAGITGSFTIEDFVTVNADAAAFTTFFSFATDTNNFLLANPHRGSDGGSATPGPVTANFKEAPDGEFTIRDTASVITSPIGTEFLYTLTYDANAPAADATQPNGVATLYLNGMQIAQGSGGSIAGYNLENVASGGLNGIGGNAPYPDPTFSGSTNEFRIYNNALSAADVLTSFQAGPTGVVPEPASLSLLGLGALGLLRRRRAM